MDGNGRRLGMPSLQTDAAGEVVKRAKTLDGSLHIARWWSVAKKQCEGTLKENEKKA
jgi:hypothetical protein